MNYKSFNLGDWIGHISGVIEDETTLDGNEMRDLVEFLTTLKQEPILDRIREEIKSKIVKRPWLDFEDRERDRNDAFLEVLDTINKYKAESENI